MRALRLALFPALALTVGCATYSGGLKGVSTAATTAATGWEAARDAWTNGRGSGESLTAVIAQLEAVAAAEPNNQDARVLLSRSYYFLADGYTEDPEQKAALWEKGVAWGEAAMAVDAQFKAQIDKGSKPQDAAAVLQKDDQMAIYWTATNLGKWARMQGFSTIVKYKGYIAKMMTKCLELDESAYWGGPVRYWGAFYAVAPGFAGGDMAKSKEMFDKAIGMFPENFATYVLYADTYATKVQDRALFEKLLKYVLDTPSDVLPDLLPEQEVEKKKAADLMARADELFAS